ncbi:hypothetical protein IAU59_005703 [Kwoniella sp. CBS 9459]
MSDSRTSLTFEGSGDENEFDQARDLHPRRSSTFPTHLAHDSHHDSIDTAPHTGLRPSGLSHSGRQSLGAPVRALRRRMVRTFSEVGQQAGRLVRRSTDTEARSSAGPSLDPQSKLIVASNDAEWTHAGEFVDDSEQDGDDDDDTRMGMGPRTHFDTYASDRTGGAMRRLGAGGPTFAEASSSSLMPRREASPYAETATSFNPYSESYSGPVTAGARTHDRETGSVISYGSSLQMRDKRDEEEALGHTASEPNDDEGDGSKLGGSAVIIRPRSAEQAGLRGERGVEEGEHLYVSQKGRKVFGGEVFMPPPE